MRDPREDPRDVLLPALQEEYRNKQRELNESKLSPQQKKALRDELAELRAHIRALQGN